MKVAHRVDPLDLDFQSVVPCKLVLLNVPNVAGLELGHFRYPSLPLSRQNVNCFLYYCFVMGVFTERGQNIIV